MGFNNGYDSGYLDALEDVRNGRIAGLGPTSSTPTPTPTPTPTEPTVDAINDGTFHAGAGNIVTGANMRFADAYPGSHVTITDEDGADVGAMVSTDASVPVTDSRFGLSIEAELMDGLEYTFVFDMVDADGQPVTVTSKARWQG